MQKGRGVASISVRKSNTVIYVHVKTLTEHVCVVGRGGGVDGEAGEECNRSHGAQHRYDAG